MWKKHDLKGYNLPVWLMPVKQGVLRLHAMPSEHKQRLLLAGALLFLIMAHLGLSQWCEAIEVKRMGLAGQVQQAIERQSRRIEMLPERHHLLKQLHDYQLATRRFFWLLSKTDDRTVCFTRLHRYQGKMYFSAEAHSSAELAAFLHDWPLTSFFRAVVVNQLRALPSGGVVVELEGIESNDELSFAGV